MMTTKMNKKLKKKAGSLPVHLSEKLLNQIITDSQSKRFNCFRLFQSRRVRSAAIVLSILLFLIFFIPGTIIPAPISNYSSTAKGNRDSATINFQINSLVPLREISALMNNKPVSVTQESYQGYSVTVHENGFLIIKATSVTGQTLSQSYDIKMLDDEPPLILNYTINNQSITIYVADKDTGIDYQNIKAYDKQKSKLDIISNYNEEEGYIILDYPKSDIYIEIPDNAGNKITYILEPVKIQQ